jgi:hypothetical protein
VKDFDAQAKVVAEDDARTFMISGETFVLRKRIRPELLAQITGLSDGEISDRIAGMDNVLRLLIRADCVERWDALRASDDDDKIVEFDVLAEIMGWAVGVLMDRPLGSASSSPTSPPANGALSMPASSPLAAVPSTV